MGDRSPAYVRGASGTLVRGLRRAERRPARRPAAEEGGRSRSASGRVPGALLAAILIDVALGEGSSPWHPVVVAGRLLEAAFRPVHRLPRDLQVPGGLLALASVAAPVAVAAGGAERVLARRGRAGSALLALLVKPTFSIRQLLGEALTVGVRLGAGDLESARHGLRSLVSRASEELPPPLVASAAIESVAENLADSVVAPLLYLTLFGLPGAALYRVVNTADAMFGYHGELEWIGRAAARLDDALSWLPSRLAAGAIVLAAGAVEGRAAARRAAAAWRRDGGRTESPNAGRPMAAMAGAIGRRLEKPAHYVLGDGMPEPGPEDVRRAVRITAVAAALVCAGAVVASPRR